MFWSAQHTGADDEFAFESWQCSRGYFKSVLHHTTHSVTLVTTMVRHAQAMLPTRRDDVHAISCPSALEMR